eukprot:4633-Heterococcus_DN1.PRE.4
MHADSPHMLMCYAGINSSLLAADSTKEEVAARQECKQLLRSAYISERIRNCNQCLLLPFVCAPYGTQVITNKQQTEPVSESSKLSNVLSPHSLSPGTLTNVQFEENAAMVATLAQKRSAAESCNPLLDSGVLWNVLSCVGPGQHLFLALVSKGWKDVYATVESQQLTIEPLTNNSSSNVLMCVPQMTLYSSVFASPSRVKLAQQSRLDCSLWYYRHAAGKYADAATLAAAHELGMEYTEMTMAAASLHNNLAAVQHLHSQNCPWSALSLERATYRGHFELVRWCYEHGWRFEVAMEGVHAAAESGNVELMVWLLQQPGMQLNEEAMTLAVFRGRMAMCQYLHAQQCPWDDSATSQAAKDGHIDILRWLIDNGCPCDAFGTGKSAAEGGGVEVLSYLQQQGLLTSAALLTVMLDLAAVFGKLNAAKWLRAQGAQWPDEFRYYLSAEIQAWARAEGCTAVMTPEDENA